MSTKIYQATSSSTLLTVLLLFACVGVDAGRSKVATIEHNTLFGGQSAHDGGHVDRRLRAGGAREYKSSDDSDEERGVLDNLVASTKKLWGKAKPSRQQLETADELFARLKTHEQTPQLFKNPVFQSWVGRVKKLHARASSADQEVLAKMTDLYGVEALAGMIATAKRSSDAKAIAIASEQENVQLTNWITQGKNADDVLLLLKLDEQGGALFSSPAVKLWASSAIKFDKNRAGEMMLQSLKQVTRNDEVSLTKMLLAAKTSPGLESIATRIEDAQLKNWLVNDKNLDDVFRLLKLDDEGTKFLQSPLVEVWTAYATRQDENRAGEMMFQSLKTRFDDVSLAKMFYEANKAPNLVTSYSIQRVNQLKEGQLTDWMTKRKRLMSLACSNLTTKDRKSSKTRF